MDGDIHETRQTESQGLQRWIPTSPSFQRQAPRHRYIHHQALHFPCYPPLTVSKGTASVVLAGLLASLKSVGGALADHTFLFLGAGEAGTGIAELIALEISKKTKAPVEETRKKIWLVDSKVFNMDGGRFIKAMFSSDKTKSITQVVMKLPNVAAEFLGCLTLMRIQCNNRCSFSRKRE